MMPMNVDYAEIAPRYDRNEIRNRIPPDPLIASLPGSAPRVLDVGCGTGTYLAAQAMHFPDRAIAWHGVDPSDAMLGIARAKAHGAALVCGRAEALPYSDAEFDAVTTRF